MKNLSKILIPIAAGIFASSKIQAQKPQISDTIVIEYSTIKKEVLMGDSVIRKNEYLVEKASKYSGGKLELEKESKFYFEEKDIGKPAGTPKNLIGRKQKDQFLTSYNAILYKYDSLGRIIEIEKTESIPNSNEQSPKKTKTYLSYTEGIKHPTKSWEDTNSSGKIDAGDRVRIYIPELDKWVSQDNSK